LFPFEAYFLLKQEVVILILKITCILDIHVLCNRSEWLTKAKSKCCHWFTADRAT